MNRLISQNKIDLLWQFTKTSFKMRYQNSLLGVLWVLIKPYSTFIVMYFLWSKIGRQSVENYQLYLLVGIVFYTYFSELVNYGNLALLDKAHIILKVNFDRQVAIISSLFTGLINLAINMVLVLVIIALTPEVDITLPGLLYFLFLTLLVFIFGAAATLFVSIINVRFRDMENITELGLFLLYWATPIFFVLDPRLLGETVTTVMAANPVGIVVNQVRAAFGIYGEVDLPLMIMYLIVGLCLFGLGWIFFSKQIRRIAEYF